MRKSVVGIMIGLSVLGANIPIAQGQEQGWGTPTRDKVCSKLQTIIPCTESTGVILEIPKGVELAWGAAGGIGYTLGAAEMERRSPTGFGLTSQQKNYLRPYFGSLVDRVVIHYNSVLLTELSVSTLNPSIIPTSTPKKIAIGNTAAQAFGLNIYLTSPFKSTFSQVALIGHELVHSRQYENLGSSLVMFGMKYFQEYKAANQSYENNEMEIEGYTLQKKIYTDDCASKNFAGKDLDDSCKYVYDDGYDYDYASPKQVVFYFDGTSGEVGGVESPQPKAAIPTTLSEADEARIASSLVPACAATYDPAPFRPGMPAWNARIGKIAFNNGTAKNIRVTLYHPDAPTTPFGIWDIAPGMNAFLGENNYGMDWAIKVDDSNPCIVGLVSDWNTFEGSNIFQTWPEKLLSEPGATPTPPAPACSIIYDPTPYRPGTPGWNGRIGKVAFYNGKDVPVKVALYHPDAPDSPFGLWDVQPKSNLYLGEHNYGMDWGIKVDEGNTCIVGTVSDWDPTAVHFQTWPERLL